MLPGLKLGKEQEEDGACQFFPPLHCNIGKARALVPGKLPIATSDSVHLCGFRQAAEEKHAQYVCLCACVLEGGAGKHKGVNEIWNWKNKRLHQSGRYTNSVYSLA